MNIFGAHIAHLRNFAGLSQKQLADRIGTGVTTVKNIESGYITSPAELLVEKLAEVFGIDSYSLLNRICLDVQERGKMVYIASCISNEKPFLEMDKIVETVFIDRDQLRGFEYMGVKVADNSMIDAHICSGASVIIRQGDIAKNGDVVVAVYKKSDAVVRRYYKNGNVVLLKAENSSGLYPDVRLDLSKDRFVMVGKVVKIIHSLE